jgi:hypothetical protein
MSVVDQVRKLEQDVVARLKELEERRLVDDRPLPVGSVR